ncbi:kunitz-type serine protease inhibitor textilinin-3-like [Drosophila rhopaloa]|uniref:Kunitz-type serine protease inhibitor textilinin-3-like n=1 Tax=Drosophila rhopaloa TaxID=1041015 RepID=A0A6P4EXF8_DRORH|nr:kunitz-type serine protease inhibitor textilinin-3-like [Drosophila rhopaloa]
MHIFLFTCLICSALGYVLALKDPICDDEVYGVGACNALIERISYRIRGNQCASRHFAGCDTVGTVFKSIKECEDTCKE